MVNSISFVLRDTRNRLRTGLNAVLSMESGPQRCARRDSATASLSAHSVQGAPEYRKITMFSIQLDPFERPHRASVAEGDGFDLPSRLSPCFFPPIDPDSFNVVLPTLLPQFRTSFAIIWEDNRVRSIMGREQTNTISL